MRDAVARWPALQRSECSGLPARHRARQGRRMIGHAQLPVPQRPREMVRAQTITFRRIMASRDIAGTFRHNSPLPPPPWITVIFSEASDVFVG